MCTGWAHESETRNHHNPTMQGRQQRTAACAQLRSIRACEREDQGTWQIPRTSFPQVSSVGV
eukprot:15177488-Alexandrium_andersonii.AAC.1